ncbi:kinase-like protein [Setomelanomma holmii]|uniref:Kinase-like protein n=1 Tax=Setomelanomma holmii TaxID=210430 RepID=A0A9P4HDB7_9PLEO|nr:kinase-like protein [Setomelanomma holmii]
MSPQKYRSIEQGGSYVDIDEKELPYKHIRVLGKGNSGFVEEVQDRSTGAVYARKHIPIVRYKREDLEKVFRNELKTIQGLEIHHHFVKVYATYVTPENFGLVLQPVASGGDLHKFLVAFWGIVDSTRETGRPDDRLVIMRAVLRRAFGCLAVGLAFMHQRRIRHRDIKPGNILIHNGEVIYTDFGYSFDFSGFDGSTTEGIPKAFTRRYSSPEIVEEEPRNRKSDVFSLGCVFLELLSALAQDRSLEATENVRFSAEMDMLHQRLATVNVDSIPDSLIDTIMCMTRREPSKRLCAVHSAEIILQMPEFYCSVCIESPLARWNEKLKGDGCESLSDESIGDYVWV